MRSWLSDTLLREILRDVEFSTLHQPKILKLMYFLSEPMRCFITYMWQGWGHFLKEGTCHPSVWAMVWRGASIHVRGSITNMYVTVLPFQLNFVVQVWAPCGFWDRIHFLCFEEVGSLHHFWEGLLYSPDGWWTSWLPTSWLGGSEVRTGATSSIPARWRTLWFLVCFILL